jgi:hypothetical protein
MQIKSKVIQGIVGDPNRGKNLLYTSETIPNLELGWERYEKILEKISERDGKLKEFALDTI